MVMREENAKFVQKNRSEIQWKTFLVKNVIAMEIPIQTL
jgi:hypothetical protein